MNKDIKKNMSLSFSDQALFNYTSTCLVISAICSFISLQFLSAPYGKHIRSGWGPLLYPPLAWFLMESPSIFISLILFPKGINYFHFKFKSIILFSPFLLHYLHRTILYPIRLHCKLSNSKKGGGFPISIAAMAFLFNVLNVYLQARWVSHYADFGTDEWFWWRFCLGLMVFALGMVINIWADLVLLRLKGDGGNYKIPRRGLFQFISCPNYFGEVVEWLGWAVMTWSWAGFVFFLFTCSNLVPRAHSNHKWYLEKFGEDYPKNRKAVIPFLY